MEASCLAFVGTALFQAGADPSQWLAQPSWLNSKSAPRELTEGGLRPSKELIYVGDIQGMRAGLPASGDSRRAAGDSLFCLISKEERLQSG